MGSVPDRGQTGIARRAPPQPGGGALLHVLSNGHGEDEIACKVIDALEARAPGALRITAWPMVGEGARYRARGIPVEGPLSLLPSEGFGTLSVRLLLRDLAAGFIATYWRQIRHARALRGRAGLILCVGDIVPLAAGWLAGGRLVHVSCAKSYYFGPPDGHTGLERAIMRRAAAVFPRDSRTARALARVGVGNIDAGNPMMDGLARRLSGPLVAPGCLGVALLAGSRQDAADNTLFLLEAGAAMARAMDRARAAGGARAASVRGGAGPGPVPGSLPGGVRGDAPGSAPGSVAGGAPGSVQGSMPGGAPRDAPGPVPGPRAGPAPGPVAGDAPGSAPGNVPGPVAGNARGPVPCPAPGDAPGPGSGETWAERAPMPALAPERLRLLAAAHDSVSLAQVAAGAAAAGWQPAPWDALPVELVPGTARAAAPPAPMAAAGSGEGTGAGAASAVSPPEAGAREASPHEGGALLALRHPSGAQALVIKGAFADVLHGAHLAVGMAGTANEQAVGLGLPLVTLAGQGNQGEAYLRMKSVFFGEAAVAVPRSPEAVAEAALAILRDPPRAARMAAAGRERMGAPGASERIAETILALAAAARGPAP